MGPSTETHLLLFVQQELGEARVSRWLRQHQRDPRFLGGELYSN